MNKVVLDDPRDRKIDVLLAKQDIHDALVRYCVGIDRGDLDLILSAFHEDARDNHTGVEEVAVERFTRTVVQGASMWTNHSLSNILIDVRGAAAGAVAYFTAWHRFDIENVSHDWVIAGRYIDRFECRGGEWRIIHRTVVYDCERFDTVGPKPTNHPAATFLDHVIRGKRSREDYFYQVFQPS